jgi:peptidoglycan/xylan/chitin deacetylase (PgdA/CDA1 family)
MYHRVLPSPDPILDDVVDAKAFEVQMRALAECFTVLSLAEAVARLGEGSLPARAACVTFDDGYRDNVEIALPILERLGVHATFFIASGFLDGGRMFNDTVIEAVRRIPGYTVSLPELGAVDLPIRSARERRLAIDRLLGKSKYLDDAARSEICQRIAALAQGHLPTDLMMSSAQLRALSAAGMEIGGHTVSHPILANTPDDVAVREIADNRAALEAITGKRVTLFAYPNGVPGQDYFAEHVRMVRECGYTGAVSTSWGAAHAESDPHQLPRFTPWDREPMRFVGRMVHNLVANRPVNAPARAADSTPAMAGAR